MKVGIIDADLLDNGTRHPNLALMKISGYLKDQGQTVELLHDYVNLDQYDKIYLSRVFDFTKIPIDLSKYQHIEIGGTGFFWTKAPDLPYEIEHHMPDYHLYDDYIEKELARGIKESYFLDYRNYSIGFASRGCFRKCDFCVNQKYDKAFRHSPIAEFHDPSRKYIYLWDDNVLACSNWREIFDELEQIGKPFQFRQGIDIRLMTEEKAKRLVNMKYKGDFIFAFDSIKDKDLIVEKLKLWKKYYTKKGNIKLYIFCGFNKEKKYDLEFWKNDLVDVFERIKTLMELGCIPYIMRHEDYLKSPYKGMYITLARWCNQPSFFKKESLREYVYITDGIGREHKDYAAKRYIEQFEKDFPDLAAQYYDMKFEKLSNKYNNMTDICSKAIVTQDRM